MAITPVLPTATAKPTRIGLGPSIALATALMLVLAAGALTLSAKHLYIVTSGSMSPTLRPGDVVYISGTSYDSLKAGDIISFDAPGLGQVVTHRIESIEPDGIITKGDLNELPDEWRLQPADIRGEMKFSVPQVGLYLSEIRRSGVGFLAVTVTLALLIIMQSKTALNEWRKWRSRAKVDSK